jgi:hypothetical protein
MDTSEGAARCWVTIRPEHEAAFTALLNALTAGGLYLAIPIGEIVLSGLSEAQISRLIAGRDDLIYRNGFDKLCILQGL